MPPTATSNMHRPDTIRRVLTATVTFLLLLAMAGPAAGAETFRLEGRGNGHGIGMSQYGAQGQALAGRTHLQILGTYYPGTTVLDRPTNADVHVSVGEDQRRLKMYVREASTTLRFSDGTTIGSAAGDVWHITTNDVGGCITKRITGGSHTKEGPCPVFDPAAGGRVQPALEAPGGKYSYHHTYGWGARIHLLPDRHSDTDRRIDVVARVPVEEYLWGLAEMPYSWEPAALRAQAIAGRSYVRDTMERSLRSDCRCHVYDDQRSQVYAGMDRALNSSTAWYWHNKWQPAVYDTTHDVVAYDGDIIPAFYSSSSNGRTEAIHELWNTSPAPYLISVKDPWTYDDAVNNPHRWWDASVAGSTMAAKVGLDEVDVVRVTERTTSGAASRVAFSGQKGGKDTTVTRSGDWVRSAFGLKSATIDRFFLPPFTDDDGNIHEAAIIWLADQGITKGCNPPSNTNYCPGDPVTRAEMATFLTRARNLTPTDENFVDVAATDTHAQSIGALAKSGITKGCNPPKNDRYCPDDPVTRAEMATFLTRAFNLKPQSEPFTDVASDDTHAQSIGALAARGITKGCNPPKNDRYCPDDAVTRAEMATFLRRAWD